MPVPPSSGVSSAIESHNASSHHNSSDQLLPVHPHDTVSVNDQRLLLLSNIIYPLYQKHRPSRLLANSQHKGDPQFRLHFFSFPFSSPFFLVLTLFIFSFGPPFQSHSPKNPAISHRANCYSALFARDAANLAPRGILPWQQHV